VIDGGIWILIILIAFVKAARVSGIAKSVSIGFLLIQTISLLNVAARAPDASRLHKKKSIKNEQAIYEFSSKKNVIMLILDSFQSDIFQEIINEDSYYSDIFDGFTYYRNAVGGFPVTYASVPLLLTGRYYDNSVPTQNFIKEAFTSDSVPKILKQNGYQVDLMVYLNCIYADETIASSWNRVKHLVVENVTSKEAALIFDVSLFRYLPHCAKRYVYNDQSWLVSNLGQNKDSSGFPAGIIRTHMQFIQQMARRAQTGSEKYTFKYIHLYFPHSPFWFNERLEHEKMKINRHNFKKQAKGSLELTKQFLDRLREIGIYENSIILVMADTGYISKIPVEMPEVKEGGHHTIPMMADVKAVAYPLFLIKPFKSKGELRTSDAPVCHGDVAKTILSALGLKSELPGTSVFEIGESDVRNRRFFYNEWARGDRDDFSEYFPPMKEYNVSGPVWLDESWTPTHRLYAKEGVKNFSPEPYQFGEKVEFGEEGNSTEYQGWGWGEPGEGFTWTAGTSTQLSIPVSKPGADIELRARFRPFLHAGMLDSQRVKIFLGRRKIGEWIVTDDKLQEQSILIPKYRIDGGVTRIVFELPDAASPAKLGTGEDTSMLGIAMHSIVLREIGGSTNYQWGSHIQFGVGGSYLLYNAEGWSSPERGQTWTQGRTASLVLPVSGAESDIKLDVMISPFIVPGKVNAQRVNVFVNGRKVDTWDIARQSRIWGKKKRKGLFRARSSIIPKNLLNNTELKITFDLPDAISPKEAGVSKDMRVLGIAFNTIVLTETGVKAKNEGLRQ